MTFGMRAALLARTASACQGLRRATASWSRRLRRGRTAPPAPEDVRRAVEVLRSAPAQQIESLGYHFQPNDFYSPLNDRAFLRANRELWEEIDMPADIEFEASAQLAVAREIADYIVELADIPARSARPDVYCWDNGFWNNADALVQYGLIRSRKPKRIVEIGCGWSSLLLAQAVERNERETGRRAAVVQIEPHPRRDVLAGLPSDWRLLPVILQRAPLDLFESMGAGDVVFFDGSHCSKVASDVNWFFFRVLPLVSAGTLIHLHDIFFPYDYPAEWVLNRGQSWNEQYILHALLMHNARYRVLIANRYLNLVHGAELDRLYRGVQPSYGCSLWMEKVHESSPGGSGPR